MKRLISPTEMLRCEKEYFASSGVASIDVMERAAARLREAVLLRFPDAKTVYFACGPGGNGGDGYACARLLHEGGLQVRIFEACEPKGGDAQVNRERALNLGIPFGGEGRPDVWVDCLFGTGLSRAPSGASAELIVRMNRDRAAGSKIVAADIPSGLNGETGEAYAPCVEADVTLTFQYAKYGHHLQDGLDMCGEVITSDVGFPAEAFPEKLPVLFEPEDIRALFAPRRRNIHKGKCGHLLIIAGSVGMAGAAALCAKAALRSGAGLVSIACPESIVPILQVHAPCAMCVPLAEENGAIIPKAGKAVCAAFAGKSAVAIGPGLSRRAAPGILEAVLDSGLPTVIDADGLNMLAENPSLMELLSERHVLTPHPGEAARLLGRRIENPVADACELAQSEAAVVLKGASRVIANGREVFISASGSSCMARGGAGDVLTGILGALLAEPCARTPMESALAACEIHGLCGVLAGEKYGIRGANALDLIEMLPEVLKKYAG